MIVYAVTTTRILFRGWNTEPAGSLTLCRWSVATVLMTFFRCKLLPVGIALLRKERRLFRRKSTMPREQGARAGRRWLQSVISKTKTSWISVKFRYFTHCCAFDIDRLHAKLELFTKAVGTFTTRSRNHSTRRDQPPARQLQLRSSKTRQFERIVERFMQQWRSPARRSPL